MSQPPRQDRPASGAAAAQLEKEARFARATGGVRGESRTLVRALVALVDQVALLGAAAGNPAAGRAPAPPAELAAREEATKVALRRCTARLRDGTLHCQVQGDRMLLDGVPVDANQLVNDAVLRRLLKRMQQLEIGTIVIRQWTTAGEVLAVARLLATGRRPDPAAPRPALLLHSWSSKVTSVAGDAPPPPLRVSPDAERALAALAAARTTAEAVQAAPPVVAALQAAAQQGDAEGVEAIAVAALAWQQALGTGAGRLAAEWVLRTLVAPAVLPLLINRLPHTTAPRALHQLLARGGEVVVRQLFERLPADEGAFARRTYFDTIEATDLGATFLVEQLQDARWMVVRNAACLLGNLGVTGADAALIATLAHAEERVRMAAARALLQLATPKGLQALHAAISDPCAEVRRVSAAAFGVPGSGPGGGRPVTQRLVAALDRERDEDVVLEMLASLGSMGSADAMQRLVRIALPAPKASIELTERAVPHDSWMRIAALEAMVRARGHYARAAIETLLEDADPEVVGAAQRLAPVVEVR